MRSLLLSAALGLGVLALVPTPADARPINCHVRPYYRPVSPTVRYGYNNFRPPKYVSPYRHYRNSRPWYGWRTYQSGTGCYPWRASPGVYRYGR